MPAHRSSTSDREPGGRADEIEFLSPRAEAFGGFGEGFTVVDPDDSAAAAFSDVDGRPRRRASSLVVGVALLGLISVGVVAAAPWSDDGDARPPVTTAASTSTAPELVTPTSPAGPQPVDEPPADAEGDSGGDGEGGGDSDGDSDGDGDAPGGAAVDLSPSGPGYVLVRPPSGITSAGAYDQPASRPATAHLDIWATPGADRSLGTWLAVATTEYADGERDLVPDASVITVGAAPALLTQDRDGVLLLTWRPAPRTRIAVAAHGFPLDHLLSLAGGIAVEGGTTSYDAAPVTVDGTPLDRVVDEARHTGDIGAQLVHGAERIAVYEDRSGTTALVVGTRKAEASDEVISRFLLASSETPSGQIVSRRVRVGDIEVAAGSLPLDPRANVVQWREGDDWITVVGTVPMDRLLRSVRTGRLATEEEWDALVDRALTPQPSSDRQPAFVTIGAGTVGGFGWGAAVSEESGYLLVRGELFYYSENVAPDPEQPISVLRSTDATFVVALLGETVDGTLVVTRDGQEPIRVRLVRMLDGTWTGAATSFQGSGDFDASIEIDGPAP